MRKLLLIRSSGQCGRHADVSRLRTTGTAREQARAERQQAREEPRGAARKSPAPTAPNALNAKFASTGRPSRSRRSRRTRGAQRRAPGAAGRRGSRPGGRPRGCSATCRRCARRAASRQTPAARPAVVAPRSRRLRAIAPNSAVRKRANGSSPQSRPLPPVSRCRCPTRSRRRRSPSVHSASAGTAIGGDNHRYDWYNYRSKNRWLFNLGYYLDPFGWGY